MSRLTTMIGGLLLLGLGCNGGLTSSAGGGMGASDCAAPVFFQGTREVVEVRRMADSADPCWWLSSGGLLTMEQGVARTFQGALSPDSVWRAHYAKSNPVDTDDGEHPQNLFRLVTRARWLDYRQEVRFRINRINLSNSPQRGEWSGVFLFQRYLDSDNLYYAGLRMDGTAVIKKKLGGRYVTLAQHPVYGQPAMYRRDTNPSLLPSGRWIDLAGTIQTEPDQSVRIALFIRDRPGPDGWRTVAETVDTGAHGAPIRVPGHGGLRADFMDVEFAGYAAVGD